MKIEKRKHKKIEIGDIVEVHSYEYIKDIINYAKLKGCDISPMMNSCMESSIRLIQ